MIHFPLGRCSMRILGYIIVMVFGFLVTAQAVVAAPADGNVMLAILAFLLAPFTVLWRLVTTGDWLILGIMVVGVVLVARR